MNKIQKLPPEVVAKIAAGEVVERPASVAKELLENALDAGSRKIQIEVQGGGRKLIRVTDDGEGMSPEESILALKRYTTSKIKTEKDLLAIHTFGFRGEALASIAAVSKIKMVTKKTGELSGMSIQLESGKIKKSEEIGCPSGTMIEVRELFFNIPARLKFLKTNGTELAHISEVLSRIALANPQTHFQLFSEERLLNNYPIRQDLTSRLSEALGREAGERMYFFESRDGEINIEGYAGEPGLNKPNSRWIYLYVNRRPVRDRLLTHAVLEAYRNLISKDRYPIVVLFVELPPFWVDVNVHPSKWEVKFADTETIHRKVVRSIREMLDHTPWLKNTMKPMREIMEIPYVYPQPEIPPSLPLESVGYYLNKRDPLQEKFPATITFIHQIDKTYLLFESMEGLILMDQHAAHERIIFDRLLEDFSSGSLPKQSLLFPIEIEAALLETKKVEEHLADFEKIGFEVEPSGERSFWLKSVPQILTHHEPLSIFREIIEEISSWGKNANIRHSFEPLLQIIACRGAVQASQVMRQEEAIALFNDLQNSTSPSHCPHGRPTLLKITLGELEKMFGRRK
jgi:DNA mismatch repair protein MutL